VPQHQVLGALLAFRAIFYLVPLLVGGLLYAKVEIRMRKQVPA
jgi:glycosyltransferase 2 family protein